MFYWTRCRRCLTATRMQGWAPSLSLPLSQNYKNTCTGSPNHSRLLFTKGLPHDRDQFFRLIGVHPVPAVLKDVHVRPVALDPVVVRPGPPEGAPLRPHEVDAQALRRRLHDAPKVGALVRLVHVSDSVEVEDPAVPVARGVHLEVRRHPRRHLERKSALRQRLDQCVWRGHRQRDAQESLDQVAGVVGRPWLLPDVSRDRVQHPHLHRPGQCLRAELVDHLHHDLSSHGVPDEHLGKQLELLQ
mmetsp:Transcript_3707/g.13405  ORF Transcript_3707/g.13405 Transcript_3707/m.13405 type:complete len:244 (-) Transcript_3707:724-1455(-)